MHRGRLSCRWSVAAQQADLEEQYLATIRSHARRSKEKYLFPGVNFQYLINFLQSVRPNARSSPTSDRSPNKAIAYLVIRSTTASPDEELTQVFSDEHSFSHDRLPQARAGQGQILFMRGLCSPSGMKAIGCQHRIDPEFFRRHLDFSQKKHYHDLPSIPSGSQNIIRIPVTDTFYRQIALTPNELRHARLGERSAIGTYQKQLISSGTTGDSIIRRYSIHTELTFSLEHEISVCVKGTSRKGWTAIVWLDVGKNVAQCQHGPWLGSSSTAYGGRDPQASCLPVIQHRSKLALEYPELVANNTPIDADANLAQSISLLPFQWGSTLHPEARKENPMYALTEIFVFAANAENQWLNMMSESIDTEHEISAGASKDLSIATFKHAKAILDVHIVRLQETMGYIKKRGDPKWPINVEHASIVDEAINSVQEDYEYLLKKAEHLASRCLEGITTMASDGQLEEARKALNEAGRTRRLTILAFFYLPLSLTTGIFGMNLKILGTGSSDLWVFIVSTVVTFIVTMLVFLGDAGLENFRRHCHHRKTLV